MAHTNIIFLFGIFSFSKIFGVSSLSLNCSASGASEKCIYKCCPIGQYISCEHKWVECKVSDVVADFSALKVYDKNFGHTGKNVQDVFTILDGRFVNDPHFRNHSYNKNRAGFIPYILENGDLQLEKPNAYPHFTAVRNVDFCVDYIITKKGGLTKDPKFYVADSDDMSAMFQMNTTYTVVARWISCVFLVLVLLVYVLLPELQNLCGLILMHYVGNLFMAFLLLAVIFVGAHPDRRCVFLTSAIYYFFLATFCWMSVMSYDIWWTFRGYAKARAIHRRGERFKLFMYGLYAYGVPLLMTIFLYVVMTVDMKHVPWFIIPRPPNTSCFLQGVPLMLYLYTPMLILIILNWMFYIMTSFNMWRLIRGTAVLDSAAAGTPAAHRSQRRRFMVYLKLSVVMGLSWLFEIISYLYPWFSMWCIPDIYNMLLGLLIFLIFVCKKKIYRKLCKRFAGDKTSRFYLNSSKSYSSNCSDSNPEAVALQVCGNPKGQHIYRATTQSY